MRPSSRPIARDAAWSRLRVPALALLLALGLAPGSVLAQYGGSSAGAGSAPSAAPSAMPTTVAPPSGPRDRESPAPSAAAAAAPQAKAPAAAGKSLPTIQGRYDVEELRRLLEVARESGFTEEQLRDITVEDEAGNTVNAWKFLEDYDRRKREEAAREAALRAKVYLSPKDVMKELDTQQPKDLGSLRDKMLFVE